VVVYRVSALTAALAKPLVRTKYFSMVNLIAERAIVPELIQDDFTVDNVAEQTLRLLSDREAIVAMRTELAEVRRKLGPPGAVERAAEAIAGLLSTLSGNAS
jgi:lipid-A-disaccharide synthase